MVAGCFPVFSCHVAFNLSSTILVVGMFINLLFSALNMFSDLGNPALVLSVIWQCYTIKLKMI